MMVPAVQLDPDDGKGWRFVKESQRAPASLLRVNRESRDGLLRRDGDPGISPWGTSRWDCDSNEANSRDHVPFPIAYLCPRAAQLSGLSTSDLMLHLGEPPTSNPHRFGAARAIHTVSEQREQREPLDRPLPTFAPTWRGERARSEYGP